MRDATVALAEGSSPQYSIVAGWSLKSGFCITSKPTLPRGKHLMPWRIEDELKALGAIQSGLWRGFAIRDGNLVTGQQNFSGWETAMAVIRALGE